MGSLGLLVLEGPHPCESLGWGCLVRGAYGSMGWGPWQWDGVQGSGPQYS